MQELVDLYDGEIRFFDAEMQRLVETIRREWGADTIVAMTSDHGDELADHGGFNHHSTYFEEVIHVPLVLDVDETRGTHDEIVELLDIAPSLLDYAGVEQPDSYVGTSVRPLVEGRSWDKNAAIIEQRDSRAYRDSNWKYITRGGEPEALYNLEKDPEERDNVLTDHGEVVERIQRHLDGHRSLIDRTDRKLDRVEIDGETQDRLEQLGYR